MDRIGAVILAAGGSSRMRHPKQFLQLQGRTLIERAVDAAEPCRPVIVVAGRDFGRVTEVLSGGHAIVVENREWARGIGTSIRCGVAEAMRVLANLDALVLMVCDQPRVTSSVIAKLIDKRLQSKYPIIASRYAGTLGVPALFDRSMFGQLCSLPDDSGAKPIIASNPAEAVDFPGGEIDIDTEVDRDAHFVQCSSTTPNQG